MIVVMINTVRSYSFAWNPNSPQLSRLTENNNKFHARKRRSKTICRLEKSGIDTASDHKQSIRDLSSSDRHILKSLPTYSSNEDYELMIKAILFSKEIQLDEPAGRSWDHIHGVTCLIADLKLDMASIVASLFLNAPQEKDSCNIFFQELEDKFGSDVRNIAERVQSLQAIPPYQYSKHDPEKYQKLLVAIADDDVRVIVIKLADQTQKAIRKLQESQEMTSRNTPNRRSQELAAREVLDVYAPLAHRLGIYTLKTTLEDMSLHLWKPAVYEQIQTLVATRQEEYQVYTDQVIDTLSSLLEEAGMTSEGIDGKKQSTFSVTGRAKSYYSIYRKMDSKDVDFGDIQDLMAFRILVDDVSQCYQALGVIYDEWKPLQGRFKDYIAQPKFNGYKSLHTTVIGHEKKRMEVQIRTYAMHDIAESGIAAHWIYKGKNNKGIIDDAQHFQWLRQLVECIQMDERKEEQNQGLMESDVFEKDVFVFSPQGNLFALAEGSSVLDFAYCIHSDLGSHCTGAKVDGRMVPLKYRLLHGDTIEIIKSNNQKPRKEWLDIVKTSKAKSRIKAWLKKKELGEESTVLGREILEKALKKYKSRQREAVDSFALYKENLDHLLSEFHLKDEQELFQAVAYGQITTRSFLQELFKLTPSKEEPFSLQEKRDELVLKSLSKIDVRPPKSDGVVIGGERNMLISFCRNCNPLHGEDVQGVITQGRGVKIHRLGCIYLQESEEERRLDAVWDTKAEGTFRPTQVEVICEDSPGVLASMSKAISSAKVIIGSATLKRVSNGRSLARFELMLSSIDQLRTVMQQLEQEPDIIAVKRR
jgi:guanosine-3',5'-bis(diphosphate) 3'-pyrophosphohydrolase